MEFEINLKIRKDFFWFFFYVIVQLFELTVDCYFYAIIESKSIFFLEIKWKETREDNSFYFNLAIPLTKTNDKIKKIGIWTKTKKIPNLQLNEIQTCHSKCNLNSLFTSCVIHPTKIFAAII